MGSWMEPRNLGPVERFPRTPLGAVVGALRSLSDADVGDGSPGRGAVERVGVVKGGDFYLLVNELVEPRATDVADGEDGVGAAAAQRLPFIVGESGPLLSGLGSLEPRRGGRAMDSFVVSGEQMERLYRETPGRFEALVHTHPSGDGSPSVEDVEVLKLMFPFYGMEYGVIVTNVCSYQGYLRGSTGSGGDGSYSDGCGPMDAVLGNWTEYGKEGVQGKWKVFLSEKSVNVDQVDL